MAYTRKRFPRNVHPLVDQDYAGKLTPAEREKWIHQFNDEFYNAVFRNNPLHRDRDQRRELGRLKAARVADSYAATNLGATEGDLPDIEADREWGATPAYLNDPVYKSRVAALRASLPTDKRRKVEITPSLVAKIEAINAISGAPSSVGEGAPFMSENRLKKLTETFQVVNQLGLTVSTHSFRGDEAEAAVNMLKFLVSLRARVVEKLKKLGVDPDAPPSAKGEEK